MNNIKIGSVIVDIILDNEDIKNTIDSRIYPLIADNSATFPFILYRRSSATNADNKDIHCDNYAYMELMVVTDSYETGVDLAVMVENQLKGKRGTFNSIPIGDISIPDSFEDYISGSYVQYLKLKIKVQ